MRTRLLSYTLYYMLRRNMSEILTAVQKARRRQICVHGRYAIFTASCLFRERGREIRFCHPCPFLERPFIFAHEWRIMKEDDVGGLRTSIMTFCKSRVFATNDFFFYSQSVMRDLIGLKTRPLKRMEKMISFGEAGRTNRKTALQRCFDCVSFTFKESDSRVYLIHINRTKRDCPYVHWKKKPH